MQREIRLLIRALAALLVAAPMAALVAGGTARAQLQGGADWDSTSREYRGSQGGVGSGGAAGPSVPAAARNATLESLNKILSTSQLSPLDRSFYLSIRAFAYSRMGREADSQKDVAEMAKVNPQGWPIILSFIMPGLAGGGDRGAALRALGYGLQKKPNDAWLLIGQAQVQMQIADFARALGTLDSAVASATTAGERRNASYFRGHANLAMGNFDQSANDFESSIAGQTTLKARIWGSLWRYAAQVRGRHDARGTLAKDLGNENLYEWPGPIAKFLLGKLPAGELEVAAESDANAKKTNGKCMAAYFIGMDAVRRGDKQRAREQLQLAQARCPTVSEYNWAASNELKRL
jgi:tetratricopeptide (TPR) repeat protein